MKCLYPDCTGEVTAQEQFCGECGRSLAPTAVAAAKAGMALNGPLPAVVPSPRTPSLPTPPLPTTAPGSALTPPPPVYMPAPVPVAAAPARSARLPWLLGGAVGAVLLSIVCCLGSLVWIGANVPLTPTAGVGQTQTFRFTLADLTPANGFKAAQDVRTAAGGKLGVISLNPNYTYEKLGSSELIGTVELRINNNVILELAASDQPEYAASNPHFEVAEVGKSYTATSPDGWQVQATVSELTVDTKPKLGTGGIGKQPVFAAMTLDVIVTPAP